jgi:quercetin dioxygenase-like cupin family protein
MIAVPGGLPDQWPEPAHGMSAVWLDGPKQDDTLDVALIRFAPEAVTPVHVHHRGQTLVGVRGRGFVEVDGVRTAIGVGDVIVCPPGHVHLHGAAEGGEFVHLSVTTGRNELLEAGSFAYPQTAGE